MGRSSNAENLTEHRNSEMKNIEQAESFLRRARTKLDEGKEQLQRCNYAESVSASQESIEFSVKTLFLACSVSFPKSHEVKELPFTKLMPRIPSAACNVYNFPRVLLLARFLAWVLFSSKVWL